MSTNMKKDFKKIQQYWYIFSGNTHILDRTKCPQGHIQSSFLYLKKKKLFKKKSNLFLGKIIIIVTYHILPIKREW